MPNFFKSHLRKNQSFQKLLPIYVKLSHVLVHSVPIFPFLMIFQLYLCEVSECSVTRVNGYKSLNILIKLSIFDTEEH